MPITWRVEECVDFVGRLLDAFGLKRANLVGVSMGGAFVLGLMKNSKIEMIPECGHLPPVEKPNLFNRIIFGFLLNKRLSIG